MLGKVLFTLLIAVVISYAVRIGVFLGFHKTLYSHSPGKCHVVEGLDEGSEDIQVLPNGKAFITSGLKFLLSEDSPINRFKCKIYLFDFNKPSEPPVSLKIVGDPKAEYFNPHGLSLWVNPDNGATYLYVVNHHPSEEVVDKYRFYPEKNILQFERRFVADGNFHLINDLVVVAEDQFYFTNYLHTGSKVELMLQLRWGSVGFYDGHSSRIVADGFFLSNGVNKSPDGKYLYVAESGGQKLNIFRRNSDNSLSFLKDVPVYTGLDNLDVDPDTGDIWVGSHPIPYKAGEHLHDPSIPAPSQVLRFRVRGDQVEAVEEIYVDATGETISGSSAAVRYKQKLLIGSVNHKALYCEMSGVE